MLRLLTGCSLLLEAPHENGVFLHIPVCPGQEGNWQRLRLSMHIFWQTTVYRERLIMFTYVGHSMAARNIKIFKKK